MVSSFSVSFDIVHLFCSRCRDSQEWILPLFIVLAALLAVIIIGCILFRVFRGIFSGKTCDTYYKNIYYCIFKIRRLDGQKIGFP